MTTVLVVEDQRALAGALEIAIDSQADLDCVGAAGSVDDAMRLAAELAPDVVLMDIHLPGIDGIEGTRRIKAIHPETRVLILTADASPDLFADGAAAGATGFLARDSTFPHILAAIRAPVDGKMIVESSTIAALLEKLVSSERPRAGPRVDQPSLTSREREILALMGDGLEPRAIAKRLVISEHTARGHVKSILRKLGVHSQLKAVLYAAHAGLLPSTPRSVRHSSMPSDSAARERRKRMA